MSLLKLNCTALCWEIQLKTVIFFKPYYLNSEHVNVNTLFDNFKYLDALLCVMSSSFILTPKFKSVQTKVINVGLLMVLDLKGEAPWILLLIFYVSCLKLFILNSCGVCCVLALLDYQTATVNVLCPCWLLLSWLCLSLLYLCLIWTCQPGDM